MLGDDQDWFDEDCLSSSQDPKTKFEETIVPLMAEPKRAPESRVKLYWQSHTLQRK